MRAECEKAQWVKAYANKPEDLSSITWNHMTTKRGGQPSQSFPLTFICVTWHVLLCLSTHTNSCKKGSNRLKYKSYSHPHQGCICTLASVCISFYAEGWTMCSELAEKRIPKRSSFAHLLHCLSQVSGSMSFLSYSGKTKCTSLSLRRIYS